jgi:hypothetical protein
LEKEWTLPDRSGHGKKAMAASQRRSPQVGVEEALHSCNPHMLIPIMIRHASDEVLESIVVTTLGLTKRFNKACLIPPQLQKLLAPLSISHKKHPCGWTT